MKLDIFSISDDVLSCIKEECKKLNVNLATTFRGSDHVKLCLAKDQPSS